MEYDSKKKKKKKKNAVCLSFPFRLRNIISEASLVDVTKATPVAQGTNRHYCRQIALRIVVGAPLLLNPAYPYSIRGPAERQKCPMSTSPADRLRDLRDR